MVRMVVRLWVLLCQCFHVMIQVAGDMMPSSTDSIKMSGLTATITQ